MKTNNGANFQALGPTTVLGDPLWATPPTGHPWLFSGQFQDNSLNMIKIRQKLTTGQTPKFFPDHCSWGPPMGNPASWTSLVIQRSVSELQFKFYQNPTETDHWASFQTFGSAHRSWGPSMDKSAPLNTSGYSADNIKIDIQILSKSDRN